MFDLKKSDLQRKIQIQSQLPTSSPIYTVVSILREHGLSEGEIKLALLTLTVTYSAYLRNPLTMIIQDGEGQAVNVIDKMIKMIPQKHIQQFSEIKPEIIFHKDHLLKNKCLIGPNSKSLCKVACHLNHLLGQGLAVIQSPYKSKYGNGIEEIRAEGPVSCILIVKDFEDCAIDHCFILKVDSSVYKTQREGQLPYRTTTGPSDDTDIFDVASAAMRFNLERLTPRNVTIPYTGQIEGFLSDQRIENNSSLQDIILRMLRTLTVINNLPKPSMNDIYARAINVDVGKIEKCRQLSGYMPEYKLITNGPQIHITTFEDLTATKIDYFILWALADGFISADNGLLNDRQLRVFKAIQKVNVDCTISSTFADAHTNSDTLIAISGNPGSWAKREAILKVANANGLKEMSLAEVEIDLKYLVEHGCIEKHRVEGKRGLLYHVMTMSVGSKIKLPHPKDIIDPIYKGEPVHVVNMLTGDLQTI